MLLTGREPKEHMVDESFKNDVSLMKKPWLWQRKVYQNMIPVLEGAIDRLDSLSKDVQINSLMKQ